MSNNMLRDDPVSSAPDASPKRIVLIALSLMLSGRAMTLLFISRAGGASAGDPPAAWLMPLVGDAVIGVSAIFVAYLVWRRAGVLAWTTAVAWNAVAIWDALSAFAIHQTVPWPSFFMVEIFGSSMFFAACAMHGVCIYLLSRREVRESFFHSDDLEGGSWRSAPQRGRQARASERSSA